MVTKRFGSNDHEVLRSRAEHCVCKQCGGKLTTSLVIYDIYGGVGEELYCPHCEKKEFGVEKEVYDLVENAVNVQLNIAKVADMMSWLLKNIDLLNNDGLKDTVPDYGYFKIKKKNRSLMKGKKMLLEGKIALVTGGSAGKGKAIVQKYLQEGAVDIATGRRQEKLDELKEQMAAPERLLTEVSDVSSREDNDKLLDFIAEQFGRLDILVNNAGISDGMQMGQDTSINLTEPLLLCQGAVKMMLTQENRGCIINVASGGGRAGAAYVASKFGLLGLTKNIAYMYGPENIRCNAICPGGIATEIGRSMGTINAYGWKRVSAGTQSIRIGRADEIADLAVYLASDKASLINGSAILADAGRSAW